MPLTIASNAVRSYRTLSPLPVPEGHRRSALCCTGRGFTPPRRYLAPCPVEPGLSSPRTVCYLRTNPSSDCPVNSGTDYSTPHPDAKAEKCVISTFMRPQHRLLQPQVQLKGCCHRNCSFALRRVQGTRLDQIAPHRRPCPLLRPVPSLDASQHARRLSLSPS